MPAWGGISDQPFALIGLFYPLALLFDGALQRQRPEQWQWIAGHAAAFALSLFVAFVMLAPASAAEWRDAAFRPDWLVEDAAGRHVLILLAGGLFCWVRGIMLSGKGLSAEAVALGFQIGLLVLLLVLAVGQGLELEQDALLWLGVAFYRPGTCHPLARSRQCRQRATRDGSPQPDIGHCRHPCRAEWSVSRGECGSSTARFWMSPWHSECVLW